MTDIQKTARLINLLRINGIQGGLLAAEVLSFIASGPRTYKELEKYTNSSNGEISKVINKMTPREKDGKVLEPRLPLLVRKRRTGSKGYELSLSLTAVTLLNESGFSTPVITVNESEKLTN
tara:strand:- start:540 stop:902 length:363 start_codon:yes stop_codon:yes gene_type:complete